MSGWVKVSEYQQIRSEGDTTLTIEDMGGYWKWTSTVGGKYTCDEDVGDYAQDAKEAKILAEFYSI